jgi:FAD/FMN-containing dehydrogenase
MALPANVSNEDFSKSLEEFQLAVGNEWVFSDERNLETYRDAYSPLRSQSDEPIASAAVAPANVEQVQRVVRIAGKYSIPIWTISTGRNFGYGGPAAVISGSVTLDLKRMNRILEVSEKYAYALVEPGVSFFELYRYLQERNIKLWLDCPGPGWGSLVGNTIEHGMGYTPYSDRMQYQCGMEVVLGDGEVIRTGMGAMPNAETWSTYKHGLGPNVDGLFYQSNLGVVTKMGIHLMPEPQVYMPCKIHVPNHEAIIPLIDTMRQPRIEGIIANNATVKSQQGSLSSVAGRGEVPGPTGWFNQIAFYGLGEVVDRHWEYIKDLHADIPGVTFESDRFTPPLDPEIMDIDQRRQAGIPALEVWNHPIFVAPVLPFDGDTCWRCIQVFDEIAKKYGRRYFGEWHHADQTRAILTTAGGQVKRDDHEFNRKSVEMVKEWVAAATEHGWGIYRMHTVGMEEARAAYNYNNGSLLSLHDRLKDTLDPNGIFSPGKNGMWPKRMREEDT